MEIFKIIYNSFLWALVIAITCFKNEWLQMRVNWGYIFFGALVLLSIALILILHKRKSKMNMIFSICNLVICVGYGIVLYGFKRLQVVPAALIREGIHQTSISFSIMNMVLLAVIVIGIVMIIFSDVKKTK